MTFRILGYGAHIKSELRRNGDMDKEIYRIKRRF